MKDVLTTIFFWPSVAKMLDLFKGTTFSASNGSESRFHEREETWGSYLFAEEGRGPRDLRTGVKSRERVR